MTYSHEIKAQTVDSQTTRHSKTEILGKQESNKLYENRNKIMNIFNRNHYMILEWNNGFWAQNAWY